MSDIKGRNKRDEKHQNKYMDPARLSNQFWVLLHPKLSLDLPSLAVVLFLLVKQGATK